MVLKDFAQLEQAARSSPRRKMAVAAAQDPHTLAAVRDAAAEGLVDYLLVGDPGAIRDAARTVGFDPAADRILAAPDEDAAARRAVALVREGKAQLLMKGKLPTATLLRQVVNKETGIGTGRLMSHLALFQIPGQPKLIAVTDGGMVPAPGLAEKKAILENAVACLQGLGIREPRVAVLCPVEVVDPKLPSTLDAGALAEMNQSGALPGCVVAGPISMDLAMSQESAAQKGFQSPVTGEADLLLVPDLCCGNILGKAFVYTAGAVMAGCILGARVPIVLCSRGATAQEKRYSIALAALAGAPPTTERKETR
ncbi:MAG: bifunctional enoyl-CoA hydratase/phosphate acetyltransferase [Angelakisella sp.]|jgi:phosphate butyryltransferase|nr:bifunctional enoyl-CoA hydratase/phosphate acetyltransferase [Angelakisella sp.]